MSHFERSRSRARDAVAGELREVIARQQIALAALSRTTGIPRSSLTRKLRGQGDLTVSELVRLSIALQVPAADLLERAVQAADVDDHGHRPNEETNPGGLGSPYSGGE